MLMDFNTFMSGLPKYIGIYIYIYNFFKKSLLGKNCFVRARRMEIKQKRRLEPWINTFMLIAPKYPVFLGISFLLENYSDSI